MDEGRPGAVAVEDDGTGLVLRFSDSTWRITVPDGWHRMDSTEDDLWCWELPGVAGARVRLRREPRIQVEFDVTNHGADVATLQGPCVVLEPNGTVVPWFAGSSGEVVTATSSETVVWVQHRGSCVASRDGFTVFTEPLLLRAGQGTSAAWRRTALPPASIPVEPAFVPRQRYFPRDESLEVDHNDAALTGSGLEVSTGSDGSVVQGPPGLHDLVFLDARGTARVEVGWFGPLGDVAATALAMPGLDPNVAAWLLAADPTGVQDVDALDVALAEALEEPSVWGVMAGMRAATLTDLPVADDVRQAAGTVWENEPDEQVRRLLATHALISGWEPDVAGQWTREVSRNTPAVPAHRMLASIGLGRISSSPLCHGGREVLLARWWLAGHGESLLTAEWEHAVDTARARLLCALTVVPDPGDVAWLLAEALLT